MLRTLSLILLAKPMVLILLLMSTAPQFTMLILTVYIILVLKNVKDALTCALNSLRFGVAYSD